MRHALAVMAMLAGPASAADCSKVSFDNRPFTICEIDASQENLRLFLYDAEGDPYGHFSAIDAALAVRGESLGFAMNAGMYHEDRSPVGLYIEDGDTRRDVVEGASYGNFGLVPNGVLCLRPGRTDVIETTRYVATRPECTYATQSGPMLVIDGNLHPRFLPDSTSRYIRNGVGTSYDGQRVVFAISSLPVTFHEFGQLFRDGLGLPHALYLDGNISRLHAPGIGRSDPGFRMGPVVGTVVPLAE